jgi:hypothetical protein
MDDDALSHERRRASIRGSLLLITDFSETNPRCPRPSEVRLVAHIVSIRGDVLPHGITLDKLVSLPPD